MKAAAERMPLRTFRDEDGRILVDLPRDPLPDASTPAPIRLLPWFDATLLTHCRRTRILPEEYRRLVFSIKVPQSIGTILVDGAIAASWRVERSGEKATLRYTAFERIAAAAERDLREEAGALVRFVEPEASSYRVVRRPAD